MDEFAIKQTTIVIYFLSETHIPGDIVFFGYPVTIGADAIATQRWYEYYHEQSDIKIGEYRRDTHDLYAPTDDIAW